MIAFNVSSAGWLVWEGRNWCGFKLFAIWPWLFAQCRPSFLHPPHRAFWFFFSHEKKARKAQNPGWCRQRQGFTRVTFGFFFCWWRWPFCNPRCNFLSSAHTWRGSFRVTFKYMRYEHDMIHELLPIHRIAKNFPCILFSMICEPLPVVVRKLFWVVQRRLGTPSGSFQWVQTAECGVWWSFALVTRSHLLDLETFGSGS